MERQSLNILNVAVLVAILAVALAFWFFAREQFAWAIILIAAILLFAAYVNAMKRLPWMSLGPQDVVVAVGALFILAFTWFYMREQFCWSWQFVIVLFLIAEYFKLKKWLKDVVNIQVIIHKKENGDSKK